MPANASLAPWRAIVATSVDWKQPHATFEDAVAGLGAELKAIAADPTLDLTAKIPWGNDQTAVGAALVDRAAPMQIMF